LYFSAVYVTGGGQTIAVQNRVRIYEIEGGVTALKRNRPSGIIKKSSSPPLDPEELNSELIDFEFDPDLPLFDEKTKGISLNDFWDETDKVYCGVDTANENSFEEYFKDDLSDDELDASSDFDWSTTLFDNDTTIIEKRKKSSCQRVSKRQKILSSPGQEEKMSITSVGCFGDETDKAESDSGDDTYN
jgi:hypothetical protein